METWKDKEGSGHYLPSVPHVQDLSGPQLVHRVPFQRIPSSKAGQAISNKWVFKAWLELQLETSSWGSCMGH